MNDQPAPQVPQTTPLESADRDKELEDAALRSTSTAGAPTGQPTNEPLPVNDSAASIAAVEGADNTGSPSDITSPSVEASAAVTAPVIETPAADTTAQVPVINVVDNTAPPVDESAQPVQDVSNSLSQPETLGTPVQAFGSEQQPTAFQQAPAQPEGLVAKFLHIFKK